MSTVRCALFALIILVFATRTQAQQGAYKTITLPEPCQNYAVDSQTGMIAGTRPARKEVVLFPKLFSEHSADDAKIVKLDDEPAQILYKPRIKGGVFVILPKKGNNISVIDPKTAAVTKTYPVIAKNVVSRLLCSLDTKDPYVYCLGGHFFDPACRIHLDTGAQQAIGRLEGVNFGAVSADGKILYWGRSNISSTGIQAHELLPGSGPGVRLRSLYQEHNSVLNYLADPHGQFVVCGEDVYAPDLRRKLGKLPFPPRLISTKKPLMFGYAGVLNVYKEFEPDLLVLSTNTMTTLGVIKGLNPVPMTERKKPFPADLDYPNKPLVMFEDPQGEAIALCRRDLILIVPLKAFGFTPEPRLVARVGGSTELVVGHPAVVTFSPHDPATTMTLDSAPKGIMYNAGKLTWTPAPDDVGAHTVVLKLSAGAVQRKQEVRLIVRAPSVELTSFPDLFHLSEPSQTGVFFSRSEPMSKNANNRLTVVDLKQLKVILTKMSVAPIDTLACDAHHVYAGYTNLEAHFLQVLDRNTLKQVKLIRVKAPIRHIVPVADRFVFALPFKADAKEAGNWMVLTVPDLQSASPSDLGLGVQLAGIGESSTAPLRADDGWYFQGVLYDNDFRKPRHVLHPFAGFNAEYVQGMQKRQAAPQLPTAFAFRSWGVHLQGPTLMQGPRKVGEVGAILRDKNNNAISTFASAIVPTQPAAATLSLQHLYESKNFSTHHRITLSYRDLLSAQRLDEFALADEPTWDFGVPFHPELSRPGVALRPLAGKLIALVGYVDWPDREKGSTRLFVIDPPRYDADKAAPPLHFETEHAATVVKGETLVPLPKLIGAPDTVQLKLRQEIPGIQLDEKARVLRVNEPVLQRSFRKALQSDKPVFEPIPDKTPLEAYALMKERHTQAFEKLMGRKAAGLPQWVRVEVEATSKEQGEAQTSFGFFIEVPEAPILAKLKGEPEPGLEETVRDLEIRVKSLEMQIERLQKSLDKLNRLLEAKGN